MNEQIKKDSKVRHKKTLQTSYHVAEARGRGSGKVRKGTHIYSKGTENEQDVRNTDLGTLHMLSLSRFSIIPGGQY